MKTLVSRHGGEQGEDSVQSRVTLRSRLLPYVFLASSVMAVIILGIILPLRAIYQALPSTPLGAWMLALMRLLFPGEPHSFANHVPPAAPHIPLLAMWTDTGLFFAAIVLLFACYLLAVRYLTGSVSPRFILISSAVLGLVYLLIPTYTSQDIFSYIIYARIGVIYHLNPLTTLPIVVRHDLVYQYVYWVGQPSAYGPVWAAITGPMQWVAALVQPNSIAPMVLLLRLWGLLMHLGSAVLIWNISGHCQRSTGTISNHARLAALLAFAWNPLLLFEASVNAHIDTTILFFVLLFVWALLPRATSTRQVHHTSGPYMAAFFLALATCLKVTMVLFLPGLLLFIWAQQPRRLRPIIAATLIYGLTIAVLYAPFWQHGAILDVFHVNPGLSRDINSPYEFFMRLFEALRGHRIIYVNSNTGSPQEIFTHKISDVVFVVGYGALCVWYFFKPERINTLPKLVGWLAVAWLLYCLAGSPWFWPWYMTAFFGLAALSMAMGSDSTALFGGQDTLGRDQSGHDTSGPYIDLRSAFFLLTFSMFTIYCISTFGPAFTGILTLPYFVVTHLRGLWGWIPLVFVVHFSKVLQSPPGVATIGAGKRTT